MCDDLSLAVVLVRRGRAAEASRAARERLGVELPAAGRMVAGDTTQLLWSGPDRFLAVRDAGGAVLSAELAGVFAGVGHVADASSSRCVLEVFGEGAVDVLNRLVPVDLHPRAFTAGSVALTVAGHIAVQIWRPAEETRFRLACASTLAASFRHQVVEAGCNFPSA